MMRKLLLALLALSVLFMGCTSGDTGADDGASDTSVSGQAGADDPAGDSPASQDDVMEEVETALADDADDVEIGEMI